MVNWTRLEMALSMVSILMMLFVAYAMSGMIFGMVGQIDNIVLQWVIMIMIIIVYVITIFGVSILISLGWQLNILNSILAFIYLMIGIPLSNILATVIWDFNTWWLIPRIPFMGLFIQLLIIILILCFIFVIPVLIATEQIKIIEAVTGQ